MTMERWRSYVTVLVIFGGFATSLGQQYSSQCDKSRNAGLPFCDSTLSIEDRVVDLIDRLTLEEKIGLVIHETKGASEEVELDDYNWWNEGLKGVANSPGVHFRPPTEYATVFPQPINLASSFNKELFFLVANVTGNEARAFFNVGNAGLTYWSPNINIYRDPRWGRGHETPGEDPHLSMEFARNFIRGLEGDKTNGFLKTSACCKHFAAHSLENDRFTFDAIVNKQDMTDTYLPVFKSCVQEADVSCIMCAYNAIDGIPACANKGFLTGVIREQWGFDGYIVSDCGAVEFVHTRHNYTNSTSAACHAVLDAGVDVECSGENTVAFFTKFLNDAVLDGSVNEGMLDTALSNGFKVLMRLGYFEKNETLPYADLVPEIVDSPAHRDLSLSAARQSIVLLKNSPTGGRSGGRPRLPLDPIKLKGATQAQMALIGPHLNASQVFLGNYFGTPSTIITPLEAVSRILPNVQHEFGCDLLSTENPHLDEAAQLAAVSSPVVVFVGIDAQRVEHESDDRVDLKLPGLQSELIRTVLDASTEPVILVLISGGAVDVEEWENDSRVGAIIWAGYLGQSGGEAISDVIFGTYNPSGRLAQTFYSNDIVDQVEKNDMNLRPGTGFPGRTYRFYTGQPVYPFGHGLSYTTFDYTFLNQVEEKITLQIHSNPSPLNQDCSATVNLVVRNSGQSSGEHSVLWFLSPPMAGQMGRPLKKLLDFNRLDNILPNQAEAVTLCLNPDQFQLANEEGEWETITGEWTLQVGNLERGIVIS